MSLQGEGYDRYLDVSDISDSTSVTKNVTKVMFLQTASHQHLDDISITVTIIMNADFSNPMLMTAY